LMEHLGVSKAAVYKQLRALEAKGLVVNREGKWQAVDGGVKA
jgi:predicted transcriptional regulator